MISFKRHKKRKETQYKTTGKVVYDEFDQKPSKSTVDEIDRVLAKHYGFTVEELSTLKGRTPETLLLANVEQIFCQLSPTTEVKAL